MSLIINLHHQCIFTDNRVQKYYCKMCCHMAETFRVYMNIDTAVYGMTMHFLLVVVSVGFFLIKSNVRTTTIKYKYTRFARVIHNTYV